MTELANRSTVEDWDQRFAEDASQLMDAQVRYLKPLTAYVEEGDTRLTRLKFDPSPASLWLWNFLLSEDERLSERLEAGHKLVGTMKDLGTIPVMAYSLPNITAFYPDGAWWIPCIMEANASALKAAEELGINESVCPVRAMVGAIAAESDFPVPDLMVCAVGATCDDFSALAQFINGLGHAIHWWELPHRRSADQGEETVTLPGGLTAPISLVNFVTEQLAEIRKVLGNYAGMELSDEMLNAGIAQANRARSLMRDIREAVFTSRKRLLSAVDLLIAEMLIIHFCSDRDECIRILEAILDEVKGREASEPDSDAVRTFWVNPPSDIKAMNIIEDCGMQLCGTDFMFTHALSAIPEEVPPLEALARCVLADPMIGPTSDRARLIADESRRLGAEAIVVSRIPGASHCAFEGNVIKELVGEELDIPVLELEIPPVCDAYEQSMRGRLEALRETVTERRDSQ
jgi:benzoyl-CoA reductase/2-hydroxyglutaryl-CoA dehydratase subunit BcrC/BadD/HgdB